MKSVTWTALRRKTGRKNKTKAQASKTGIQKYHKKRCWCCFLRLSESWANHKFSRWITQGIIMQPLHTSTAMHAFSTSTGLLQPYISGSHVTWAEAFEKTGGNTVKCQLHQERAATTLPDRGGRRLLCVTSERPECRLATDIKQTDHFVFTSGYQQLTIWPELATISCVSEPCKCLHRLLGECAINVDLKEKNLWGMKGHFNAWWNGQWKTKWLWIHN